MSSEKKIDDWKTHKEFFKILRRIDESIFGVGIAKEHYETNKQIIKVSTTDV